MQPSQDQQDLFSLIQHDGGDNSISRRRFLHTALGAGFAAAALPVCAQTMITTPDTGLVTGQFSVDVQGQAVPVYLAKPAKGSNFPVILVTSEIFGVHAHIADVARRFAQAGYLAVAPDLFVRQGNPAAYPTIAELISQVINKVPDQQVMQDLDAVLAWTKTQGGDISRAAITGFCWGGRITWLYAAHNPSIRAGVAWYGRLTGNQSALNPQHPVDIAAGLRVPVLGLYGAKDTGIPLSSVEAMQKALAQGKSQSAFHVYPDSGHAFHADYRPSYMEADARDGWQRCLQWLRDHQAV
ncbi:dienelactone hydrolase family protein [Undibacterium luofuense]|uniref:Dienelactone hydrolase family protein n=1 Tax=Undibacterium luofuense TaxID=2828733 RepID=A0A941DJ73_9BURK|nr:dienelactone hydrolase family protein [Undibacterium luofuense]MBR7781034.1 dienelactone hydrolase family protein [Undibacterium luofuense]